MKMSLDLEEYVINHISPEPEVLYEMYRYTNNKLLFPRMLSGNLQGQTLRMFSKMIRPKYILELGTFTGYSAICLSEGLQPNGKLHTIEANDELADIIQFFIAKAGLTERIELHIGDAVQIIENLDMVFDLVFIDADKREYLAYYETVLPKVTKGGFIIADNVLWDGKVTDKPETWDEYTKGIVEFNDFVRKDTRVEKVLLPMRDGLMIMIKNE